jgi:hypothetical protein
MGPGKGTVCAGQYAAWMSAGEPGGCLMCLGPQICQWSRCLRCSSTLLVTLASWLGCLGARQVWLCRIMGREGDLLCATAVRCLY